MNDDKVCPNFLEFEQVCYAVNPMRDKNAKGSPLLASLSRLIENNAYILLSSTGWID